MINEIAFVGVPVTDIKKAREFYEGVLGLKYTQESAGGKWIEYDLGATTFAIGAYPQWKPSAEGTLVAFEVDDLNAEMSRLKSRGVTVTMDVMESPVCHSAMIADPDGNKIMLHKRKS